MSQPGDSSQALARRLRALRERHWPGLGITQSQLAHALGDDKPLSLSLISSWENPHKSVMPPVNRLEAYASFFATKRSVERKPYRVLPVADLTADEQATRNELLAELMGLRSGEHDQAELVEDNLWRLPGTYDITIVCAQLPRKLQYNMSYTDPDSPDYVALYTYADLDALIELYGHLRAFNPASQVNFRTAQELKQDDYTTHLVLLGGVDWNFVTRDLLERVELPVRQVGRHEESDIGGFEVETGGGKRLFAPKLDESGQLVEDVAHFYRGPNPFNAKRTVTVCNGMFGRGTLGAVRALTDVKFRDRNGSYVRERFGSETFSVISRVLIVQGNTLTPDWTEPENRLHEWTKATE